MLPIMFHLVITTYLNPTADGNIIFNIIIEAIRSMTSVMQAIISAQLHTACRLLIFEPQHRDNIADIKPDRILRKSTETYR